MSAPDVWEEVATGASAAAAIIARLAHRREEIVDRVVEQLAGDGAITDPQDQAAAAAIAGEIVGRLLTAAAGPDTGAVDEALLASRARSWTTAMLERCLRTALEAILDRATATVVGLDQADAVAGLACIARRLSWAAVRVHEAIAPHAIHGADPASAEDVLHAILHGRYASEELAVRAAMRAGHDVRTPHGFVGFAASGDAGDVANAVATMRRLVAAVVAVRREPGAAQATLVVAAPLPTCRMLRTDAGSEHGPTWSHAFQMAAQVAQAHGVGAVAVEPVSGLAALRRSVILTERLSRLAAGQPGRLLTQRDLSLDLLLDSVDAGARDLFVDTALAPVLRLTASRAAPLLETIRAITRSGGSFVVAARLLGVHRETVKYRAQRLRDLTGYSVTDPGHLMRLDLALRLHQSTELQAAATTTAERTLMGGRYR